MNAASSAGLVSVVLPVYNGGPGLEQVIESVLAQTHSRLELVISDNASTDVTQEIGRSFARSDPRVVYARHPVNVGVLANFTSAAARTSGAYLRWIGDDDFLEPDYVSRVLEQFAEDRKRVLVSNQIVYVDPGGRETLSTDHDPAPLASGDPVVRLAAMLGLMTSGFAVLDPLYSMMRRELAVLPRRNMLREDEVFAARLALAGPWGHVAAPLARRNRTEARASEITRLLGVPDWHRHLVDEAQCRELLAWIARSPLDPSQRRRARVEVSKMYARRKRNTVRRGVAKARRAVPRAAVPVATTAAHSSSQVSRALGAADVALVTVSYRGDLDLARELCRSVDRHLPEGAEHVLVVPRSDLGLFRPLAGPRRRIVTVESVLPPGFVKLPAPRTLRVGRFERRVREIWLGPSGVVRGWIVQQLVKLSVPAFVDREVVVFADSDIVLVAPVTVERLVQDDRVRLYAVPGAAADLASHVSWHDVSARLLGLEPRGYLGADYIGNLITWRRSTVLKLQERLAEVGGIPWHRVVARCRNFSEYVAYGVFADLVLGDDLAGHYRSSEDLVHAGWFYDLGSAEGVQQFLDGFTPGQVGVAIQSTERFTIAQRQAMVRAMVEAVTGAVADRTAAQRAEV